jgi:phosphatidylglycerophosphatase C
VTSPAVESSASATRSRRLAVFDLDGTLSRRDTFFPWALGLLARHPLRCMRAPLLLFAALAYALRLIDRGDLKGAVLWILFSGTSREEIRNWSGRYAARVVPQRLFPAALQAFRAHLSAGDYVVLLSASPDIFVPQIGAALQAHETLCTQIRWDGDRLDGRLAGPNRRDEEKARVLEQLRQRHPGLPVIAYGNSSADLPHLYRCEEGVFVNASPARAAQLSRRGLRCVQWD